jgi:hypothetical protein
VSGTVKERSVWRVAVAVYLYQPAVILRCDILDERTQEFEIDVPSLDWADIVKSYNDGACCLGDAQAFVNAWHEVIRVVKLAKRDSGYVSDAWIGGAGR